MSSQPEDADFDRNRKGAMESDDRDLEKLEAVKDDEHTGQPEPQAEVPAPPPPVTFPEGGAQAWAVVAGSSCILFCTFGYLNAYGVYQNYYQTHQLANEEASTIAWIGSVQTCLLLGGGIVGGPLFDRYGAVKVSFFFL